MSRKLLILLSVLALLVVFPQTSTASPCDKFEDNIDEPYQEAWAGRSRITLRYYYKYYRIRGSASATIDSVQVFTKNPKLKKLFSKCSTSAKLWRKVEKLLDHWVTCWDLLDGKRWHWLESKVKSYVKQIAAQNRIWWSRNDDVAVTIDGAEPMQCTEAWKRFWRQKPQ